MGPAPERMPATAEGRRESGERQGLERAAGEGRGTDPKR